MKSNTCWRWVQSNGIPQRPCVDQVPVVSALASRTNFNHDRNHISIILVLQLSALKEDICVCGRHTTLARESKKESVAERSNSSRVPLASGIAERTNFNK